MHVPVSPGLPFAPATLDGGAGTEDGFAFVSNAEAAALGAGSVAEAHAESFHLAVRCDGEATVFRACRAVEREAAWRVAPTFRVGSRLRGTEAG